MTSLDIFLKLLLREGYPNENLESLSKFVGYDLDDFLADMENQHGHDAVMKFVSKGLEKMMGDNLIYTLDLVPYGYYDGTYLKFQIFRFNYQSNDYKDGIIVHGDIIDSQICHPDNKCESLDEIYDNADMGEWGDVEDLKEELLNSLSHKIHESLGYYLHFE